jgi:hypothetical protein
MHVNDIYKWQDKGCECHVCNKHRAMLIEKADKLLYCLLEDLKDTSPVITKKEIINAVEYIKSALEVEDAG